MIQSVVSSDITVAGQMEFVSNGAALEVPLIPPAAPGLVFSNASGQTDFQPGDNLLLRRVRVTVPFGFGQGSGTAFFTLAWKDPANVPFIVGEIGAFGNSNLPSICDPLEYAGDGLFLAPPKNGDPMRLFLLALTQMNFSMVNLPSILNGVTVKVQVHLEISHTLPMA